MSRRPRRPSRSRSPISIAMAVAAAATGVGCRGRWNPNGASADGAAPRAASERPAVSAAPNALPFPTASVAAAVNPEKLPPYEGPTGSVEGTIFVRGPGSPDRPAVDVKNCPAALDTYGKLFRAGPPDSQGRRPLADALVVVTGYSGYFVPDSSPVEQVTITARCAYPARAIAMTYGQRLEIANDSRIPFAPYIEGSFQSAIMIAPPKRAGDPVKLYPPRPGHYVLADRLQTFAIGDLYVLRYALHAVTDLDGHYRIDGVPTAKVKVGAVLDAIHKEVEREVDVRANVVEHVDMVMTYAPSDAGAVPVRPPHFIP